MVKSFNPPKYRGRPIWAVDCETDPFKRGRIPAPFVWGVYTGSEYHQFTDTEEMIIFLQENDVICYAHNGGKFDWHFITEYISDYEPLTIIAGRLAKFKIGYCEFRDSINIIPAPLAAYKKDEIDYSIFEESERNKPENWQLICDYLKADCIYLHEMVTQFIESYGMALTQAGAAMKIWAKMSGIQKPNTGPDYYADFSKYYYGGRVECFQKGIIEDNFSVIDIRSAYPYAMTFDHPWSGIYAVYDNIPEDIDDERLSRCFISLYAKGKGAFPLRGKNGLIFPNDNETHRFHITGWEYISARETNSLEISSIEEVTEFLDTVNFTDYVDYFFAVKNEADANMKSSVGSERDYWASQRLFAKIFLNALYGKFASNPDNYEEYMTVPAEFIDAANQDGWGFCQLIAEETAIVAKPLEEEKKRFYDVSVAASITGFVRAYLWRHICKTKGTMLYCDTDSIAASYFEGINLEEGLGNWELEAQCDFAAIGGKKLYAFRKLNGDWKTATKGVRLEPEEIIAIASGKAVTYHPEIPTFSIKRGIKFTPRTIKMLD